MFRVWGARSASSDATHNARPRCVQLLHILSIIAIAFTATNPHLVMTRFPPLAAFQQSCWRFTGSTWRSLLFSAQNFLTHIICRRVEKEAQAYPDLRSRPTWPKPLSRAQVPATLPPQAHHRWGRKLSTLFSTVCDHQTLAGDCDLEHSTLDGAAWCVKLKQWRGWTTLQIPGTSHPCCLKVVKCQDN